MAVLGPTASSVDALIGDFYADPSGLCPSSGLDCVVTAGKALAAANTGGSTVVLSGVTMQGNDSSWGAALASVAKSDAVVLALGTDRSVAGEGNDRSDIGLPGLQTPFGLAVLAAAHAAGVPVILLLIHNLPCSFDELVQPANATYTPVAAIVDAWAPTTHVAAVAAAMFGGANRWGRAVLTVYPRAYQDSISLFSFDMSAAPGRSYKYYGGPALVRFGEGLSYSSYGLACSGGFTSADASTITVDCVVRSVDGPDGDEVLLVLHRPSGETAAFVNGTHPLPLAALRDFARVAVAAGGSATVSFTLPTAQALGLTNENGAQVLYPGLHFLDVWNGNSQNVTIALQYPGPATIVKSPPRP